LRKEVANKDKDVLDENLGFPNYINVLNSFRNPDLLTGDALQVIKGNKYRAKMANRVEEAKDLEEKLDKEAEEENDESEEGDEEAEESSGEPEIPSRYYHKESKAIRCINCKEIGHMMRNCPNESRVPLCKFCGTSHGKEDY